MKKTEQNLLAIVEIKTLSILNAKLIVTLIVDHGLWRDKWI